MPHDAQCLLLTQKKLNSATRFYHEDMANGPAKRQNSSVSYPYSLNPDPAKNLNPNPEDP